MPCRCILGAAVAEYHTPGSAAHFLLGTDNEGLEQGMAMELITVERFDLNHRAGLGHTCGRQT